MIPNNTSDAWKQLKIRHLYYRLIYNGNGVFWQNRGSYGMYGEIIFAKQRSFLLQMHRYIDR